MRLRRLKLSTNEGESNEIKKEVFFLFISLKIIEKKKKKIK